MKYTRQGSDEITIDASAPEIWSFLVDPLMIPKWNSLVQDVSVPGGQREHEGAVRSCEVEFGGRKGQVEERCVECIPDEKLTHVLEADNLGIGRMFSDFAFSARSAPMAEPRRGCVCRLFTGPREPSPGFSTFSSCGANSAQRGARCSSD